MSKSIYLSIDWKSGKARETSKEKKEDFEAYTYTDKAGNEVTRYKKLYPEIVGSFEGVQLKESPFGMQLVASFKDEDTYYNFQVALLDQRSQVTTYASEIARYLPSLEKGKVYRVFPYLIEKDAENKYEKRGISFKVGDADGPKVVPTLSWAKDAKDGIRIPQLDWKEDKMTGKKMPTAASIEAQRDFFADIFEQEIKRIESSTAVKSEGKKDFGPPADSGNKAENLKPEEDDDLPF